MLIGLGSLLQHLFQAVKCIQRCYKDLYQVPPLKGNYKRAVIQTEHLTPEYVQFMTYYMNIELNFAFNSNMRLGRYDVALESFENVINVKSDHAIAHYYYSVCAEKIGDSKKSHRHLQIAKKIINSTDFWDIFIDDFSLPLEKYYSQRAESPAMIRTN